MSSMMETAVAAPAKPAAPVLARVLELKPQDSKLACATADGREFMLTRLIGSNLRIGDEMAVADSSGTATANSEVYIRKPSVRGTDVYQLKAGYATLPKQDKREESFVRVQVPAGQFGIDAVHIPCSVIRDYFFAVDRRASWAKQPTFYYLLRLPRDVTFKELRLAYRLRRMELQKENASTAELATLERAYNLLADPGIRAQYDNLLRDATTPVAFPYSGFGSLIVRGERSADSGVFFANRILAFLPERRHRTVPVPLRKLDYFEDYAILRDHNRKIEVLIDHQLLPLRWDPTWSRWRNLISATVQISADFVHTGHYRKRGGEWKLIESETALPSRTELTVPDGLEEEILKARTAHTRFGQYWKQIDRLRAHVEEIPTERDELRRLCWNQGLPGDFDVAQINWRPDYDSYYHEQLNKRARTMYVFRDEYIFDLEKSVVVEVPQAGHATYVFSKPPDVKHWVWQYAKTTRQDIRHNRNNIAESLGFQGRIVHGKNKSEWLRELRLRIGEPPDPALQPSP
jgi:curved DNA-binding protein CbpA